MQKGDSFGFKTGQAKEWNVSIMSKLYGAGGMPGGMPAQGAGEPAGPTVEEVD